MGLSRISELCYNLTSSYLSIQNRTDIIKETQNAIVLTRRYIVQDIFTRWSPFNGEISFSYNGGKDCQVLLLIYLSCLWEFFLQQASKSQFEAEYHRFPLDKLPAVFIDQRETFPTLEDFVSSTTERYFLSLYDSVREHQSAITMPQAFQRYLEVHTKTKAIVIGIRHTDPFAQDLEPVQRTDPDWPDFMRLQPLLHWKLTHIWSFLLYSGEPICGLYKVGFTSVGNIEETIPNPYLKIAPNKEPKIQFQWEIEHAFCEKADCSRKTINCSELNDKDVKFMKKFGWNYLPGWYLTDDLLERAGRIKRTQKTQH